VNRNIFSLPSEEVDQYFNLKVNETEAILFEEARALRPQGNLDNLSEVLHDGNQTWIGLDPQTLNTPYAELVQMCDMLRPPPGETVVDLGCSYGRMGIVLGKLYPEVHFIGYEYVKERVDEGNRVLVELDCSKATLYTQDLMDEDFVLPRATYYFLYDFGKTSHIRNILNKLEDQTSSNRFKVIARGKGSRSIIEHEHPWLSQINPVQHEKNFSIYTF
jgi:hypothetical protein